MKQRSIKLVLLGFCFMGLAWPAARANEGGLIVPEKADDAVEFMLSGEHEAVEPAQLLQVFVGEAALCCDNKTPMVGSYRVEGQSISFTPAFDFVEGQSYTVLTRNAKIAGEIEGRKTEFSVGPQDEPTTPEVVAIYPSGAKIPENTLRFYIHFSTPMKPHMSEQFILLADANGEVDNAAFMTFKQELWNESRTRLTLLLDPGRIKRGVAQNLALGPALLEGNRYSIVIEEGWPSASGEKSARQFEQSFVVSEALRTLPNIDLWHFYPPKIASIDPLIIEFDRPFDLPLAQSSISVLDENEKAVDGVVTVDNNEKIWRFQPDRTWETSVLRIVVDARLEDVAGNNFRELLDHAIETDLRQIDHEVIHINLAPASE
ncbi:MAG: hypothetical protein AAGF25_13260 [Pseudomonadota bacterium]